MSERGYLSGDSNNRAFSMNKIKHAPSLFYIATKVRHSIKTIHSIHDKIKSIDIPDIHTKTILISDSCFAFRKNIIAYLALFNMLALVNDTDLNEKLLSSSKKELDNWLDIIAREGGLEG